LTTRRRRRLLPWFPLARTVLYGHRTETLSETFDRGGSHPVRNSDHVLSNVALPHPQDCPTCLLGKRGNTNITRPILRHLLLPPTGVRTTERPRRVFGAPVPEAAINEHGQAPARQNEVWCTTTSDATVEPETQAQAVDSRTKSSLGERVPRPTAS
jgi:hypothetical protein